MNTTKSLEKFLNDNLQAADKSISQYESFYKELSELLFDIDGNFEIELIPDAQYGKALYDEQENVLKVFLNVNNDFHYYVYEVLEEFINKENVDDEAYKYFSSLLQNDKIDFITKKIIEIAQKKQLNDLEEKLISGAHEYLWRVVELLGGQDEEEIHDDVLYSVKIVNSLLRFADLQLDDMEVFELQYEFGNLNLEKLENFLKHEQFESYNNEEFQDLYHQAIDVINAFINEINSFFPGTKISNLSKTQLISYISELGFIEILKWLIYLKKNKKFDILKGLLEQLVKDQQKALSHEHWDEALPLSNLILSVDRDNIFYRLLRIEALLGLRLYYDAYQDFIQLINKDLEKNKLFFSIQNKFISLGLNIKV